MQTTKSSYQTGENSKPRQRRRRDQRAENPPRMVETERVCEIVKAVYEYRVMTQGQIQRLFFGVNPGARSRAARTLAKMFDNHYLERHFLPTRGGLQNSTAIYSLGHRGAEALRIQYGIEPKWYASSRDLRNEFLEHSIAISEVRLAVELACRSHGYGLRWTGETEIKSSGYDRVSLKGHKEPAAILPDGYFVVSGTPQGTTHFMLELDRATEQNSRFKTKIEAYIEYHRGGKYEARYGTRSLRVLTVTLGERRLANLKATTEAAGGENRFWFALLSDIQRPDTDILVAPVWQIAQRSGLHSLFPQG